MMGAQSPPKGRPLAALAFVLGGWISLRALAIGFAGDPLAPHSAKEPRNVAPSASLPRDAPSFAAPSPPAPLALAPPRRPIDAAPPLPPLHALQLAAGHQLLYLAAMGELPTPWAPGIPQSAPAPAALVSAGLAPPETPAPAATPPAARLAPDPGTTSARAISAPGLGAGPAALGAGPSPAPRLGGDGWLLVRGAASPGSDGLVPPTYGASQAGAVLRYRLDQGGRHRVNLYLRGATALDSVADAGVGSAREAEAAAGLSLLPVARWPMALAAEARISRFADGKTHLRPAVLAISQLPPIALPLGWRVDLYAAGGYVGGAAATGFADGQAHLDHLVAQLGRLELRLGGGAWGGAEQGVARLDLGPNASAHLMVGAVGARLGLDWRIRVAGNAQPISGPALTLGASF